MLCRVFLLSIINFLLLTQAFGEVQRISSTTKNMGKVEKIFLSEGLISVLDFPEAVAEVKIGNEKNFRIITSEKFPNELTLFLAKGTTGVFTNLIVRTGRGVYVFDLVSHRYNHQDYLKILGTYGRPISKQSSDEKLVVRVPIEGNKK